MRISLFFLLVFLQSTCALQKVAQIHIPKTAGTSFYEQYKHEYKFLYSSPGRDEKSFTHYKKVKAENLGTFFRWPQNHVYSLYLECKYDDWGKSITRWTRFPRIAKENVTTGYTPAFTLWLEYFTKNMKTTKNFNCYQPNNMQTRIMMTDKMGGHNFDIHANKFTTETKKRIMQLDWFGITEKYTTSTCLFEYHMKGYLPKKCDCTAGPKPKSNEKWIRHGVPKHKYSDLSHYTKSLVNKLIKEDTLLFNFALRVFNKRVQKLEQKLGVMLC